MKILIVEDSRLARQELRTLLSTWSDIEVIGEAADIESARVQIDAGRPELLLLDIHLDGGSGFELLDRIDYLPRVIFTTAYDQHAVQAFEHNALDYLLKPIETERLGQALQRARESMNTGLRGAQATQVPRKGAEERIFVRDGERCWFVSLAEISGFEAWGNYARVWFADQHPLLSRNLAYLEQRLDSSLFFRASRSQLINLRWVSEIVPWVNEGYLITLRDGRQIETSRRQAKALRDQLEL